MRDKEASMKISAMKFCTLFVMICLQLCVVQSEVQATTVSLSFKSATTAIDDGPQDGVFDSFAPFNLGSVNNNGWTSFRTALEFDISAIPAGSVINAATLTMSFGWVEGTRQIALNGYAGDGTVQLADFSRDGLIATTTLSPPGSQFVGFDVTQFIRNLVINHNAIAGFNLREDPANAFNYAMFSFDIGPASPVLSIDFSTAVQACYSELPQAALTVTGTEDYTTPDGGEFTRYMLSVTNWSVFPNELFETAPDLPPCGGNQSASRTWVNIYEQSGAYVYGFCGLNSSALLKDALWFAVPRGVAPPEYVYITLTDRRCGITYFSTLALTNLRPVAEAGDNQTVHPGTSVTLDGTGSTDPDGNFPLTYQWTIVGLPKCSSTSLSDPTSARPSFVVDCDSQFRISLTVTDSKGLSSTPDYVSIYGSVNSPPIADAGPDQVIVHIGTTVFLNASGSYDPDGDPISYKWWLTKPADSTATLEGFYTATPSFQADKYGTYELRVAVSDKWGARSEDVVVVSFDNVAPMADAGMSGTAVVNQTVTLNGSASYDANSDPLTYQWALTLFPEGSTAAIVNPTAVNPVFVPDLPGLYVVQLVVSDGKLNSNTSTVQVQVISQQSAAMYAINAIIESVGSLESGDLKNANMKNALINKLNAVIATIEAGNYGEALNKLQNDVLEKTDGCAIGGVLDPNDWITSCPAQNQVYPLILETIQQVRALM